MTHLDGHHDESDLSSTKGRWRGLSILGRIDASGDCWEWTGSTSVGYGQVQLHGRRQLVHRVMWQCLVGPIPEGLDIDHLCRNRLCCNPDHLEPVTRAENVARSPAYAATMRRNGYAAGLRQKAMHDALYANRTHCFHGHEWIDENLYTALSGKVNCRPCNNERSAAYRQRKAST